MQMELSTDISRAFRELECTFLNLFQRFQEIDVPRSVAELRLPEQDVRALKEQFRGLPFDPRLWLWDRIRRQLAEGVRASPSEILGGLLLVLAAEVCREEGTEGAVWPYVRSCIPERFVAELFPGGQPSLELKQALVDATRLLGLRNAIGWDDSLEYFNTVKLQFGFTLRGARRKLAYWLVGVGEPVAVRALRGEDSDHPEAESHSFRRLWFALQNYRRSQLEEDDAREVLEQSPWVRNRWVPDLLKQARAHLERLGTGEEASTDTRTGSEEEALPFEMSLEWGGSDPQLKLRVDADEVEELVAGWGASRIQFLMDGELLATWVREKGGWHRSTVFRLPSWRSVTLSITSPDGRNGRDFDLADAGLNEDLLIFDPAANGHLLGPREKMDRRREYALVCDEALELTGADSAVVDQHRNRVEGSTDWPLAGPRRCA